MSTPVSTPLDSDPERTAELPVLDPSSPAPGERAKSRTDTWVSPPPPQRAPEVRSGDTTTQHRAESAASGERRRAEPGVQALTAKLHETQTQLAGKQERLAQAERARDEAQAGFAASEERAAQLRTELEQLRAEHSFQQDEHARSRAHFEEELAQARTL